MDQSGLSVRRMAQADIEAASQMLYQCGLCESDEARLRLGSALSGTQTCAFIAQCGGTPVGVLLACYNGFHLYVSHIAVIKQSQSKGVGSALLEEATKHAQAVNARGIITDARLSSVGFFQKHGYRLPGAVFLIHDVGASA